MRLTTLPPSRADCLKILGALTSGILVTYLVQHRDSSTFTQSSKHCFLGKLNLMLPLHPRTYFLISYEPTTVDYSDRMISNVFKFFSMRICYGCANVVRLEKENHYHLSVPVHQTRGNNVWREYNYHFSVTLSKWVQLPLNIHYDWGQFSVINLQHKHHPDADTQRWMYG
jgi:hypothetical protein